MSSSLISSSNSTRDRVRGLETWVRLDGLNSFFAHMLNFSAMHKRMRESPSLYTYCHKTKQKYFTAGKALNSQPPRIEHAPKQPYRTHDRRTTHTQTDKRLHPPASKTKPENNADISKRGSAPPHSSTRLSLLALASQEKAQLVGFHDAAN